MRITPSHINPLKDFLESLIKHDQEFIPLTTNNLPIIALYFNSGGVTCETHEEVVKLLNLLADETGLIEVKENKLRITEYGKDAFEASKGSICSIQELKKDGSQPEAQATKSAESLPK